LISDRDICVIVRATNENLIVLEVRKLNMLTRESTITLPYLWGRTVGKAAKTEPLKLPQPIGVRRSSWGQGHVTHTLGVTLTLYSKTTRRFKFKSLAVAIALESKRALSTLVDFATD